LKILIVAELNREVIALKERLQFDHHIDANYSSYKYSNLAVDILVTGIGSVFMTYNLQRAFNMVNYDLVINMGTAGSFDHFLEQGFVVNVVRDQFADLGIQQGDKFYTLIEEELMNENEFPFVAGTLNSLGNYELEEIESLIPVRAITVNTFRSEPGWIASVKSKFEPEIVTMSGAAFFYTCLCEKVPFLQIRAVSSFVEIRRIENWNMPKAIKNLTGSIISILDELKID
jgi:futalosine hydrolase